VTRNRESAGQVNSELSGIWIFLIVFAVALCAIGLIFVAWVLCCRNKERTKRGHEYDRLDSDRYYDPIEAEMVQQFSPRILMPPISDEPPPLIAINFEQSGAVSSPAMMHADSYADYRRKPTGGLGHNYSAAGVRM
jgi:hypothetical protein